MRQQPFHQQQQMRQHRSIGSTRDGNRISSSYYSLTVPFIMHRPNVGSGGHLIVVLTLLGGTKRNRHPRPTLRWAACTSASGAEDLGIWPRSVPFHSGSKVHAIVVKYGHRYHNCITNKYHTPFLPVVVVDRRIEQWRNNKMAAIIRKMIVGR